jgi:hypothetical protein
MHPETRGGWPAFVFIELPRPGVPHPCVLWGNPGTRRDIPHFSFYAAKVKLSCWASSTWFLGRPAFRGVRARKVECSKSATNFSDPSGLPVWVYCRRVARRLGDSPAARCCLHSATVQRSISITLRQSSSTICFCNPGAVLL